MSSFVQMPFTASAVVLLAITTIAACKSAKVEKTAVQSASVDTPAIVTGCGDAGALSADLYGSLETRIDWSGSQLLCENMLRPGGEGIRLRFEGNIRDSRLAFIIALPKLKHGQSMLELPSNVTATVEGSGRFFNTPNLDTCWTDIETLGAPAEKDTTYAISGTLYCVAPLGEVNGDAAISIPELEFTTLIDWENS